METPRKQIELIARKFMASGDTGGASLDELAIACNSVVNSVARKSLAAGLHMAKTFNSHAEQLNGEIVAVSRRALARLLHMNSRHTEAERAYIAARKLTKDPILRTRIDRALIDVYMYLNKFTMAETRAKQAIAVFTEQNLHADRAMTQVNYANLLHRQDKHKEAESLYHQAERYFREAKNDLAVARCAYNRANSLVQLFDMEMAEELFAESLDIYEKNGFDIDGNDARYGLAWLHMLQGKFHQALKELTECEINYRQARQWRGVNLCALDRAEVFLNLNLQDETRILARKAGRWFLSKGLVYESSKAYLFRAIAARGLGATKEFNTSIAKAIDGFTECQNEGFMAVARFYKEHPLHRQNDNVIQLDVVRKLFNRAQLPLWQAYCDLALISHDEKQALKRLENNPAIDWVPHLYAQWNVMLGDKQAENGNIDSARLFWQKAADRLDAVKAGLPPLELRTGYAQINTNPHSRLINLELKNNPHVAGAWIERFKMSGMWTPLNSNVFDSNDQRVRLEETLHSLSMQVSAIANGTAINKSERWNVAEGLGEKYTRNTQRKIREQLSLLEEITSCNADRIDSLSNEIMRLSKDCSIVQFFVDGNELAAIVHYQMKSRVVRWHDGCRRIESLLRRWRFILESNIHRNNNDDSRTLALEHRLFSEIGEFLWSKLEIPQNAKKILIIPDGDLANLPWQAVIHNEKSLLESYNIVISPSIRHYIKSLRKMKAADNFEVFIGKSDDLEQVDKEIEAFRSLSSRNLTIHELSTRDDWPTSGLARVWHFSGHANYNADNPFYSYLEMNDGPFFAVDFRLRNADVYLTTLASCRSGEQVRMPGEESIGFVRSLLEMGSRNVIAAHWPVSDASTAMWIVTFYRQYLNNNSLSESFRAASQKVRKHFPSAYHWGAFSLFGAGV